MTIQKKVIEQYFPLVFFLCLFEMGLAFESVNDVLKSDHLNVQDAGIKQINEKKKSIDS